MNPKLIKGAVAATIAVALAGGAYFTRPSSTSPSAPAPSAAAAATAALDVSPSAAKLKALLANYRKIIVLLADEKSLSAEGNAAVNRVGQALFHENQSHTADLDTALGALAASVHPGRIPAIESLLDYIESDQDLFDADRLAFRELLRSLLGAVAKDTSLPAIKLHKRISEDLDALAEIERNYEKEIRQVFGRYEQRAIELKRERWSEYLAHLNKRYSREQILKEHGVVLAYIKLPGGAVPDAEPKSEGEEIFGRN